MKEVFPSSVVRASLFHGESKEVGVNIQQLLIGLCVLALGAVFYYLFRTVESTYFLKFFDSTPQLKHILHPVFITFGNSLPTFVHVLAFIFITAGLITNNNKGYALICFFWFGVDVFFEVGQGLDFIILRFIPDRFSDFFFLENTKNYFLHGRFDYFDLLSIVLGSFIAYILLIMTKKENGHEKRAISNV